MAKSKDQKRQEAQWRNLRGELVRAFRNGSDEKVADEFGAYYVEKRETLWRNYLAIPREWRDSAMNSLGEWAVPHNLAKRLEQEAIEQQARDLAHATDEVQVVRKRMRL